MHLLLQCDGLQINEALAHQYFYYTYCTMSDINGGDDDDDDKFQKIESANKDWQAADTKTFSQTVICIIYMYIKGMVRSRAYLVIYS